jgi:hypothetical protein
VLLLDQQALTMMHCHELMQDICSRMQPASANAHATADTMLQPVLHLLGPAVLQQLEATYSSTTSSSDSSSSSSRVDGIMGGKVDPISAKQFAKLAKWLVAAGTMSLCSQEIRVFVPQSILNMLSMRCTDKICCLMPAVD